jgi:hypothetical protein
MPLEFFLWGYVKDQRYSQRVNMLDKLKAQITAATANVTEHLQEVGCVQSYRLALNVKCFAPNNFSSCV